MYRLALTKNFGFSHSKPNPFLKIAHKLKAGGK